MNLAAALEELGHHDRPALVVDQRTLSHREVHDGAARMAARLALLGVRRGDTVLLVLPDGPELAWAFLGTVRLGAVAVPVNPQLPGHDHRHLVDDCRAALVVCADELADRFPPPVVCSGSLASLLAGCTPHPPAPADAADPAYAQYTSGTTGLPRAALHRHGDPLVYAEAFARPVLGLAAADVVLSVSKMFFAYGLGNSLFFPLISGARAVVHPGRLRPDEVAELIERHRVTVLFAVPTFYANLVRAGLPAASFASLRVAVSAGERLTGALAERAEGLLGCPVLDSLGSTEVGQAFVSGSFEERRPGTIGRALPPYEVAVRDADGGDRPPGQVGMLWARGPTVLLEYLGQPKATAETFDGDWLRTGDLASLDGDGFVSLHGRADDMEMVGGITVAPQEIEELLSSHPAVSEVAVVAAIDEHGSSRLKAFVVTGGGVPGDDRVATELRDLARHHLAPYKVPRSVRFVDALPRSPTGKLQRFVLRSGADGAPSRWPPGRHELSPG